MKKTAKIPTLYPITGVKIGVTQAHVRYPNRDDLTIFEIAEGSSVAVVTTKNEFCAAPVQLLRQFIRDEQRPRYLVVNTGNANAATGEDGKDRAFAVCQALAKKTGVATTQVLPYSTGVIGEKLPSETLIAHLDKALSNLDETHWLKAAYGIMTTDVVAKGHSVQVSVDDITYTVTGIAKGAGMIRPNMATMLAFVATDANIDELLLRQILRDVTNHSFNKITIDGDTSTNDCCTLIATAKVGEKIDSMFHPHFQALYQAIEEVMLTLAMMIVRDGEGATKFITITVTGGKTSQDCANVAYAVAQSPLVKTAFFACDPNWGRILAAIGYAGVPLSQETVTVSLNEVCVFQRGQLATTYTEEQGQHVMKKDEIVVTIDLAQGDACDTVYTCDLSEEYVKINADYRS